MEVLTRVRNLYDRETVHHLFLFLKFYLQINKFCYVCDRYVVFLLNRFYALYSNEIFISSH